MDNNNNNNRLFLNFGNSNSRNDERFGVNDQAYPTTPSTFPQPVFSQGQGQQASSQIQNPQQQQQFYNQGGYTPAPNYFVNNQQSQSQYAQQPLQSHSQFQQPAATYQPRSAHGNTDVTNGLAHQFSNQNLGGAARGQYQPRQPSPSQRPRTAGASGQQQSYGSYLNAPMPSQPSQQFFPEFQQAPERNPDQYGHNSQNNQKKCSQLAADFFKDSVKRARDRNVRCAPPLQTWV